MGKKDFDCIVVGFGTAGAPAALAAARMGTKVLVLERGNAPGGTHTAGFIWGYYDKAGTGILREMDGHAGKDITIVEAKKIFLEQEVLQNGGVIEYEAAILDVEWEGDLILSLTYMDGEGSSHTVTADTFIDGTADGYFSILAACTMFGGRESDGVFQPYTNSMGMLDGIREVCCNNFDAGRIDPYSEPQYSHNLLASMMPHCFPDYSPRRHLLMISHVAGIREGLHVKTREIATFSDLVEKGLLPAEPVLTIYSNIDAHTKDIALESELLQEWMIGCSLWGQDLYITVPYGSIFAAERRNLLVAGRHLGVDHDIGHALRMNGCMGAVGECAGIVAGLAARKGVCVDKIAYGEVAPHLPPSPYAPSNNAASLHFTPEEIHKALAGEKWGGELWSARNDLSSETLREWYKEAAPGSDLKKHLAFALALKRDPSGVEDLRAMAKKRDPYRPSHSRNYNHARGYVSVYFLGLLRDRASIGLLQELLREEGEGSFEYVSFALTALLKIGEAFPEERENIAGGLIPLAKDPAWKLEAPLKGYTKDRKRLDLFFRLAVVRELDSWGIPQDISACLAGLALDPFEKFLVEKYS